MELNHVRHSEIKFFFFFFITKTHVKVDSTYRQETGVFVVEETGIFSKRMFVYPVFICRRG